MLVRFAGRDDAYGFFFVILILHAIDVDNQQHRAGCGSYGVPPLFACHDPVLAENCVGIVENKRGRLDARPSCFCWLIRFFSPSHSNRTAIQNV
jgi:hypothetical protein